MPERISTNSFARRSFLTNPRSPSDRAEESSEYSRAKDFSSLARLYSEDSSARSDGDLGLRKKDLLAKEFVDILSGMNAGDYSMPFWTDRGLHIIRLDEKVSSQNPDKVKEVVRKKL